MSEYRFDLEQGQVPAGRIVLETENVGELDHDLHLIELPDDFPPIVDGIAKRGLATPTMAVLPVRAPGQAGVMAVDLAPGRYAFFCFVRDGDGRTHSGKGMKVEFRVE